MFVDYLEKLCQTRGLSLHGLTEELGLSPRVIRRWRTGTRPRDSILKRIAEYFGIPFEDLLYDGGVIYGMPIDAQIAKNKVNISLFNSEELDKSQSADVSPVSIDSLYEKQIRMLEEMNENYDRHISELMRLIKRLKKDVAILQKENADLRGRLRKS